MAPNLESFEDAAAAKALYITKANILKHRIIQNSQALYQILADVQPKKVTTYEIERSIETLENIYKNSQFFEKSVKQASIFMPSNLPLYSFILFGIVPSFMVTEKVIIKPNQLMREKEVFERFFEVLEIGNLFENIELINNETHEFISKYVPNSDVVIFTGYNKNRDKILSVIKPGSLLIYNGSGHNPIVVGKNANIEKAVKDSCYARFFNSGQDCAGPDAIFVQKEKYDEFMEKYLIEVSKLKVGPYTDEEIDVGPITRCSELQKFLTILHEANPDDIKLGGMIDMKSKIISPTVIFSQISPESNMTETFGPISFVYSYEKDDDLSMYFKDTNGNYLRNKMYVSLYGKNSYISKNDDSLLAKKNGIGIVLYEKNIHDHEEGDKEYGGYSLGASGVYLKTESGLVQSKAMPIYIPEVIASLVDQKLFKKEKSCKKSENSKIFAEIQNEIQQSFEENLVFGFISGKSTSENLEIFVSINERNFEQEKTFNQWLTTFENNNIVKNECFIVKIVSLKELQASLNTSNNIEKAANLYEYASILAGPKTAVTGDKTFLSKLTATSNNILKKQIYVKKISISNNFVDVNRKTSVQG